MSEGQERGYRQQVVSFLVRRNQPRRNLEVIRACAQRWGSRESLLGFGLGNEVRKLNMPHWELIELINWCIGYWCFFLLVILFWNPSDKAEYSKTEGSKTCQWRFPSFSNFPWFPRPLFAGADHKLDKAEVGEKEPTWLDQLAPGPTKIETCLECVDMFGPDLVQLIPLFAEQSLGCMNHQESHEWHGIGFLFVSRRLSLSIGIWAIQFLFLPRWHFWILDILMPAASIGILGWKYGTVGQVWRVQKHSWLLPIEPATLTPEASVAQFYAEAAEIVQKHVHPEAILAPLPAEEWQDGNVATSTIPYYVDLCCILWDLVVRCVFYVMTVNL